MNYSLKSSKLLQSIIVFLLIYLLSAQTASANINIKENKTKAAVLIEESTGKILFEDNKDEILGQASVTKLMTYYIVRDYIKENNIPLTKKITVDADFSMVPFDGTQLRLQKGDILTLDELLSSLLIMSANDSAIQLEKMVEDASGKKFLDLMNLKAEEIGLGITKYINTSGLTEVNGEEKIYNKTTAYETAVLSKRIIDEYPDTLKITSKKSFTYKGVTFTNTNKLLTYRKNVDGLKTGFTSEAGYCLSSTESIKPKSNEEGEFRLVAVTLGSETEKDRTVVNSKLLKYGEENFENKKLADKEKVVDILSEYHKGGTVQTKVSEDVYYLLKKGSNVEVKSELINKVKSDIKSGDVVGKMTINIEGSTIEEDLIATSDVDRVGIFKRIGLFFKGLF